MYCFTIYDSRPEMVNLMKLREHVEGAVYFGRDRHLSDEGVALNRAEVLHPVPVQGNHLTFREKLAPGLCYWKLESKEELLHVGKFYVGRKE